MQYRLTELPPLSHDVTRLTLTPVSGAVPAFRPGQYLEIVLAPDIRCAYSIACAPRPDGSLELHVRAVPQSENYLRLKAHLIPDALLEIELPFGDICLESAGRIAGEAGTETTPLLLLAGSTGFSQAKALIEGWAQQGCPRPLQVYWGARSPQDLYLHEWVVTMARQHERLHYVPVVSDQVDQWHGRQGFVHKAVLADVGDLNSLTIIGCGSPPMVYAAYDDFMAAGMKPSQLLSDVFAYAPRPDSPPAGE